MRATKRSDALARRSGCGWSEEPDEESLWKSEKVPLKLTLLLLGSFGALPCTWKKPHLPSRHPTKSTFVFGIASSVTIFVCLYHGVSFFIYRLRNEDIPLRVKITLSIYLTLCLYSPAIVLVWIDLPAIRQMILIWMRLSRLYFELMKKRPKIRWQLAEKIVLALSLIAPTVVLELVKETQLELQLTYEYIAPFAYLALIILPLVLLWAGYCNFFAMYVKEINEEIAQCVQQNSLTSEKLQIYREIWIQMRSCGDTMSGFNTYFLLLVVTFPSLIIGVYALILHIQAEIYYTSASLLIFCVTVTMLIGWVGITTNFLVDEIKVLYTSILSLQNFSSIKRGPQCQIINLYLMEKLRPMKPTFCGFLLITKAVIPSLLSAVTMNIVVLAQLTQPQYS